MWILDLTIFTASMRTANLVADTARDWLAINGQPVAYYHIDTIDDGENYTITGRVPAMLNGERVELILVFDNDNPYGFVAGASKQYNEETETMTIAKNLVEISNGDKIDFLCAISIPTRRRVPGQLLSR